jgi:hypothetical protein
MKPQILLATAILGLATLSEARAVVTITRQPTNQWVSLGAHVTNQVSLTSTAPPITYQWHGPSGQLLTGEMNVSYVTLELVLPSIQTTQAGEYDVVLSDADPGSVQSDTARISVNPTFIKITEGPLVTTVARSHNATWWDYDGDGYLDLIVQWVSNVNPGVAQAFYRNQGDGTFVQITTTAIALTPRNGLGGAVGDCDNDGDQDVYLTSGYQSGETPLDDLFRNDGNGRFTALLDQPWSMDFDFSFDCSFVDLDQDGWLDVFVNISSFSVGQPPCVYRQTPPGTFVKLTDAEVGSILTSVLLSDNAAWVDYDNDGDLDLLRVDYRGGSELHQNNGRGFFQVATPASLVQSPGGKGYWVDFDNDGFPELFVGGSAEPPIRPNALYRGVGGQNFTDVTAQAGVGVTMSTWAAAVGDYDNDGWLDILATDCDFSGGTASRPNVLFHNRGDGTFEQVDVGSPIRDGDSRIDVRFVDYDNDGFLDLLMICGSDFLRLNHMYRNNGLGIGNTNHWLKIKLNGQASNRSGIGAKIRVKATIGGKEIWQMREMTGNGYSQTCPGLIAHFGLGDSVQATTVRIEWPSGVVQELANVAAGQVLTVTEHQVGSPQPPSFAGASFSPIGFDLTIAEPAAGVVYVLESSTDLATWTKLMVRTSTGGTYEWVDEQASNQPTRFYRLVVP